MQPTWDHTYQVKNVLHILNMVSMVPYWLQHILKLISMVPWGYLPSPCNTPNSLYSLHHYLIGTIFGNYTFYVVLHFLIDLMKQPQYGGIESLSTINEIIYFVSAIRR